MSATTTVAVPKRQRTNGHAKVTSKQVTIDNDGIQENPSNWPRDLIEAYHRWPGPYSIDNADAILEHETVELYNGWLVWQEMTNLRERQIVANIQSMLDISARKADFGQILSEQMEWLLSNGSAIKPDASLISW